MSADLVTLTIDGREVRVPKGTNVLEAAREAGVDISYFCYHPGLSSPAVCRQCLVDIKGQPKLAPSCYTPALDKMEVVTNSEKVLLARQQMLEFTLVNHPVDCPICDKAGECTLQKLYFEWDTKASRVTLDKVHKPKKVDLGPAIVLDQERCILCTRCIRVCDEIAKAPQLGMAFRGDHEVLTTPPGMQLDNPYSLNTVDVCPVGALTSKDFRFTLRAWELVATESVCTGCATGCNVEVHHREGQIYRLVPRHNPDVNKYWMCDEGRFTYRGVHAERVAAPQVAGMPTSWDKALATAVADLEKVLDADRQKVGVVLAAGHTNEDNWLAWRLAREFLQLERVYLAGRPAVPEREDGILRVADVNANLAGVRAMTGTGVHGLTALEKDLESKALRALIVLGSETPLSDFALEEAAGLDALVVLAAHERGLAARAKVLFPAASWAEVDGTITNKDGRVQRLRAAVPAAGQALAAWEILVRLARKMGAAFDYPHARAVFTEMTGRVAAFSGAEWGKNKRSVQLRFAGSRG